MTILEATMGTADSSAVREQLLQAVASRLNVQAHKQGTDYELRRDTRPFDAGMIPDGELRAHLLYTGIIRRTAHIGHRGAKGAPSGLLVRSTAVVRLSYRLRTDADDIQDGDYAKALQLKDHLSAILVTAFDTSTIDADYVPDTLVSTCGPMPGQFPYLLLECSLDVTHVLEL